MLSAKSCGFVNFQSVDHAITARVAMNGVEFLSEILRVGFAKSLEPSDNSSTLHPSSHNSTSLRTHSISSTTSSTYNYPQVSTSSFPPPASAPTFQSHDSTYAPPSAPTPPFPHPHSSSPQKPAHFHQQNSLSTLNTLTNAETSSPSLNFHATHHHPITNDTLASSSLPHDSSVLAYSFDISMLEDLEPVMPVSQGEFPILCTASDFVFYFSRQLRK